jgi:arabinose-5-phosphate isomerase
MSEKYAQTSEVSEGAGDAEGTSDDLARARAFVLAEAAAVGRLADHLDGLPRVVDLLATATGKIVTGGSGTSGAVARRFAHLLSVSGTPAVFLHPGDAVHGSVGAVAAGDVLVLFSKGGDTDEVTLTAERARARGARVLVLTTRPESPLAAVADEVHVLPPAGVEDPEGVIAMGSTLVAGAFGDAVALTLMHRRGYPLSEVLQSHPAGAVGKAAAAGAPDGDGGAR